MASAVRGMAWLDDLGDARVAEISARIGATLQHSEIGWFMAPMAVLFLTPSLVTGAFGWRAPDWLPSRYHPWLPSLPRGRWVLVAAIAATLAVNFAAASLTYGKSGKYQTADEAGRVRNGQVVERRSWAQADGAFAGCKHRSNGRSPDEYAPFVRIHFPGGRTALLEAGRLDDAGISLWLDRAGPILAGVRRAHAREPAAVTLDVRFPRLWLAERLSDDVLARLDGFLAPAYAPAP